MPHTISRPNIKPSRVLIIDDDKHDLDAWSDGLTECHATYTILKADTINAGLDEFHYDKIDCVVLDLDFSECSGFEVLLKLVPNRRDPEIAVIILTKFASPHIRSLALHHGAKAYLVKSHTSPQQLHEAIQKGIASIGADLNTP